MNTNTETKGNCGDAGVKSSPLLGKSSCMVVFDDEGGLVCPMGWDEECEGALDYSSPAVIFPDRKAARKAIAISRKFAALRKEQGGIVNTDWTAECSKCIKVVPVISA